MPVTETARGRTSASAATARRGPRRQAWPGSWRSRSAVATSRCGMRDRATTRPAASTATALTDVVPMSTPTVTSATAIAPLLRRALAHHAVVAAQRVVGRRRQIDLAAERTGAPHDLRGSFDDAELMDRLGRRVADGDRAMVRQQRGADGAEAVRRVLAQIRRAGHRILSDRHVAPHVDRELVDRRGDRLPGQREHRRIDRVCVDDGSDLGKPLVTGQVHELLARWRPRSLDNLAGCIEDDEVGQSHLVVRDRRRGDDDTAILEPAGDVAARAGGEIQPKHVLRGGENLVVHAHEAAPAGAWLSTIDMNWSKSRVLSTTMSR